MSEKNYISEKRKSIGFALFQFALLPYASVNVLFLKPRDLADEERSWFLTQQEDLIEGVSLLQYYISFGGLLALVICGLWLFINSYDQRPKGFCLVLALQVVGTLLATTIGMWGASIVFQFALIVVAQGIVVVTGWMISTATKNTLVNSDPVAADNPPIETPSIGSGLWLAAFLVFSLIVKFLEVVVYLFFR